MISRSSLAQYSKSHNIKELAILYEETPKTINAWLKPHAADIGVKYGKRYSPKQVNIIFEKLGVPQKILDEQENE
jgi:hypothetical protein